MSTQPPSVHLVVPCFRESGRIGVFLPELCEAMTRLGGVQIQVVEDGSGPEEAAAMKAVVDGLRPSFPCLLPLKVLTENLGKGGAVYAGWADHAGAQWLGFVDADGSCSASEVDRLIRLLPPPGGAPRALFASRVKMLGRRVERLLKRHLLGRIYATLVSEMLDIPVYDSQCGLKLVPRASFEEIAGGLQVKGFAFDVELMTALLDGGCEVVEVPVDWHETPGGKVRLLRDSWRMALDVWLIRKARQARRKGG
jgi:dolichyl-phosphate beta-glucosyltransferase